MQIGKEKVATTREDTNKFFNLLNLRSNGTFTNLVLLIFLVFGLIGIFNHEMWRDETQAWMIARDSLSINELFENLRYEGHPGLWHFGLYVLSKFSHNPIIMQVYHLIIAATVIYIITRSSPFTRLQNFLISFGYFFFYEYSIISRNYSLGLLFIFGFCALFRKRHQSYLILSFLLFLASNTNFYALVIAIALGSTLIWECILDKSIANTLTQRKWDVALSLILFISGIVISTLQIITPADGGTATGWITGFDIKRLVSTLATVWKSYMPMPGISYNFWNTNIIDNIAATIPSIILLAFSISLFYRKPVILFLYISGTLGNLLFTYFKFPGVMRHWGHLFILLLVCLWLSSYFNEVEVSRQATKNTLHKIADFFNRRKQRFIMVILYTHFIAGLFSYSMDLFNPFSEGKEVVGFIQNQKMEDVAIAGYRDVPVSTIAGFLDRKIYYPESSRFGSFVIYGGKRKYMLPREIVEDVNKEAIKIKQNILLVTNKEIDVNEFTTSKIKISEITRFTRAIVKDENFYLYLVK